MKTQDLRIGNIIEWNKLYYKVCAIFEDRVENELWCKPISELHPILLTEEILLKAGFEKCNTPPFVNEKAYSFLSEAKKIIWCEGYITKETTAGQILLTSGIIYLHQLQNLIHALTGEELEIKL